MNAASSRSLANDCGSLNDLESRQRPLQFRNSCVGSGEASTATFIRVPRAAEGVPVANPQFRCRSLASRRVQAIPGCEEPSDVPVRNRSHAYSTGITFEGRKPDV